MCLCRWATIPPEKQMARHYKNYTDDDIREAVASSISYAQVVKKLGLIPSPAHYTSAAGTLSRNSWYEIPELSGLGAVKKAPVGFTHTFTTPS